MPKIAVIGEETQHGPRANCEFIGVAIGTQHVLGFSKYIRTQEVERTN